MEKMRRKMLALGYQLGFDKPLTEAQRMLPRYKVNAQNVNAWCRGRHSIYGKPLNSLTYQELVETVSQFQALADRQSKQE